MPLEVFRGPDGLPVLDRSGAEAAACGHRYNQLYNLGVQDDSEYSLRGVACHVVKRKYVDRLVAAQTEMDLEEAQLAFQEGIAEVKLPPQLIAEVHNIFFRHAQHFALRLDSFMAAEHRRVNMDVPLPYKFEPDLEYIHAERNEVEIDDGKSYYRAFTDAQAREQFQTIYYIWAAMQEYPGYAHYRMTYSFWRLNQYATTVFEASDFPMLDEIVHAYDLARRRRYETNDWTPTAGEQCGFCNLACPLMVNPVLAHPRVNSKESFRDVASRLIVLEKETKRIKDALKTYVIVEGEQDVSGEIFRFRPSVSRTFPAGNVVDAIRAKGHQPDFTVSASSLKVLFKAIPSLEQDLAGSEKRKESARFGHRSLKADLRDRENEENGDDE